MKNERPLSTLTTAELFGLVHDLPPGSGKRWEPKATDLSPVTLASIEENLKIKTANTEKQEQK
jgi:hypothetical protein